MWRLSHLLGLPTRRARDAAERAKIRIARRPARNLISREPAGSLDSHHHLGVAAMIMNGCTVGS